MPESSGRFWQAAMKSFATALNSAKPTPCASSSWSWKPPAAPRPWMGGGGTGKQFASGISRSFGSARTITARAFCVAGSRSSHGCSTAIRNAAFVCCVPVRKLKPSICSTFATASSAATIARTFSLTSTVRGRLEPGGSCTPTK